MSEQRLFNDLYALFKRHGYSGQLAVRYLNGGVSLRWLSVPPSPDDVEVEVQIRRPTDGDADR